MGVLPAHVCWCIIFVPITHRGQRTTVDAPEVELQAVENCHVGAKNQTQILCEHDQYSYPPGHPPLLNL